MRFNVFCHVINSTYWKFIEKKVEKNLNWISQPKNVINQIKYWKIASRFAFRVREIRRKSWKKLKGKLTRLPAFFRWSSIITDDIMKILPTLPTHDIIVRKMIRVKRGHSVDSNTGETLSGWKLCFACLPMTDKGTIIVEWIVSISFAFSWVVVGVSVVVHAAVVSNMSKKLVDVKFAIVFVW